MAYEILLAEYAEIDDVPLSTTGWTHTSLTELFDGADTRGGVRLRPGAGGVVSFPQRVALSTRNLPMMVFGDLDGEGEAYDDLRYGLESNQLFLRDNVLAPVETTDGTRELTLHLAGDREMTARVRVQGSMRLASFAPSIFAGTMVLEFPYGMPTEVP